MGAREIKGINGTPSSGGGSGLDKLFPSDDNSAGLIDNPNFRDWMLGEMERWNEHSKQRPEIIRKKLPRAGFRNFGRVAPIIGIKRPEPFKFNIPESFSEPKRTLSAGYSAWNHPPAASDNPIQ